MLGCNQVMIQRCTYGLINRIGLDLSECNQVTIQHNTYGLIDIQRWGVDSLCFRTGMVVVLLNQRGCGVSLIWASESAWWSCYWINVKAVIHWSVLPCSPSLQWVGGKTGRHDIDIPQSSDEIYKNGVRSTDIKLNQWRRECLWPREVTHVVTPPPPFSTWETPLSQFNFFIP